MMAKEGDANETATLSIIVNVKMLLIKLRYASQNGSA
jgi:hypothetical protein